MNRDIVETPTCDVIRGALYTWGTLGDSTFLKTSEVDGLLEIRDSLGQILATVRRDDSPIGQVWCIALDNRRERVWPSVVSALRYLRGYICPERESGRVLFGRSES